jgi:hypothetical protein
MIDMIGVPIFEPFPFEFMLEFEFSLTISWTNPDKMATHKLYP